MQRKLQTGYWGACLASMTILADCQTVRPTPSSVTPDSTSKSIPNTWVSGSEQHKQEGAYLSAKAAPAESDEVRNVDCGSDYELISEGPATSEVGMAVDVDRNADHAPRPFIRHYCKTDKAVMP